MSTTLRSIAAHPDSLCRRCKPAVEGTGFLLTDSANVSMFFCVRCVEKMARAVGWEETDCSVRYNVDTTGIVNDVSPSDDPTREQFYAYMGAFDHFNASLFDWTLPRCMLNFSRKSKVRGFFAAERWRRQDAPTHEISLNPDLLFRPIEEVMSTLVHEMVHLRQFEFGQPSRGGYHNAEWADWMEEVGLMPSDTGRPGGRRTGQRVSHYVIEGGRFQHAFRNMPRTCLLPWQSGIIPTMRQQSKGKIGYLCPKGCGARVWGKPGLSLICGVCQAFFDPYLSTSVSA